MTHTVQRLMRRGNVWYVRVTYRGRSYLRSTGTASIEEARRFRNRFLQALREQRLDALEGAKLRTDETAAPATLRELVSCYLAEVAVRGAPREKTARNNVLSLYRVVVVGLGVADAAGLPCASLTGDLVRRYASAVIPASSTAPRAVLDTARRTVRSTLRQARSVLAPKLRTAYARLRLDPALVEEFCAEYVCEDPGVAREELSERERAILYRGRELLDVDPPAYAAWILGYYLGLRASEIAAARWSWFERRPEDGVLECVVRDRPDQGFAPKGFSGWVPVHDDVWTMLQCLRLGPVGDAEWCVPGGSHNQRYQAVTRRLAAALRAWGWTRRHCGHELRACAGQRWRDVYGVETARDWLRHSSVAVQRHYTVGHDRSRQPVF